MTLLGTEASMCADNTSKSAEGCLTAGAFKQWVFKVEVRI